MDIPRILIVDDETDARESLKSFLSRRIQCEIAEAVDGRQALEVVRKGSFDLIILDIRMPGISGLEVLKRVKSEYPDTDVLMLTAYDSQQVAQEVLKAGAADYIIKPSTLDVVFAPVRDILTKRNMYLPLDKTV